MYLIKAMMRYLMTIDIPMIIGRKSEWKYDNYG